MQINLKQGEIEEAIRVYIANKGFTLFNKTVTMSFTAGRKSTGVSAEVTIEEAEGVNHARTEDLVVYVPYVKADEPDTKAAEPEVEVVYPKEAKEDPEVAVEGVVVNVKTVSSLFS